MVLNLLLPSGSIIHVNFHGAKEFSDFKRCALVNSLCLLVDQSDSRDQEDDRLALGVVLGCNPFNEKDTNEGLPGASVQGGNNIL